MDFELPTSTSHHVFIIENMKKVKETDYVDTLYELSVIFIISGLILGFLLQMIAGQVGYGFGLGMITAGIALFVGIAPLRLR